MYLKRHALKLENIENGDIIGVTADTIIDDIIKSMSSNIITHVGVFLVEDYEIFIIEASPKGIIKTALNAYLTRFDDEYGNKKGKLFHFALSQKNREKFDDVAFENYVKKSIGTPYDWEQVALAGIDFLDSIGITKNKKDDTKLFCSEFAIRCLQEAKIIDNDEIASEFTPSDVSQLGIYDTVKSCQFYGEKTYVRKFNYIGGLK